MGDIMEGETKNYNHLTPKTLRGKLMFVVDAICLIALLSTPFLVNKPVFVGGVPIVYLWSIMWGLIWLIALNVVNTIER